MKFDEPIKFMKKRIEYLEYQLRRHANFNDASEIRARLMSGIMREIEDFKSAVAYLEDWPTQSDLEEKQNAERLRHFSGDAFEER